MKEIKTSPRQSHSIKVQFDDGRIVDAELVYFARYSSELDAGATCLELYIENAGDFYQESHNYFDALIELRKELEPMQIKLLCFGARKDVWASGMQRDMGAGLFAYLLSADGEGRKPEQSIFDYAPPDKIGNVGEQRNNAEGWLNQNRSVRP
jgi:hypothetical protein